MPSSLAALRRDEDGDAVAFVFPPVGHRFGHRANEMNSQPPGAAVVQVGRYLGGRHRGGIERAPVVLDVDAHSAGLDGQFQIDHAVPEIVVSVLEDVEDHLFDGQVHRVGDAGLHPVDIQEVGDARIQALEFKDAVLDLGRELGLARFRSLLRGGGADQSGRRLEARHDRDHLLHVRGFERFFDHRLRVQDDELAAPIAQRLRAAEQQPDAQRGDEVDLAEVDDRATISLGGD